MVILSYLGKFTYSKLYQKAMVCARFRDWKRNKTGLISLEKIWSQREQNGTFPTFEDVLSQNASIFVLKRWITFNPNAKVENWSFLGSKTPHTSETIVTVSFLKFPRTTTETPSRFTQILSNLDQNRQNASRRLSSERYLLRIWQNGRTGGGTILKIHSKWSKYHYV